MIQRAALYFWATHSGAELDLFFSKGGRRHGVEFKRADAPRLSPSMRSALDDLELDALMVVYPGHQPYPVAERVTVTPLDEIVTGERTLLP